VDFTGGVSETLDLKANDYDEQEDKRSILFEKLVEEVKDHSVMCSVITVSHIPYIYIFEDRVQGVNCKEVTDLFYISVFINPIVSPYCFVRNDFELHLLVLIVSGE
jgi:hypothetical protein